MQDYKPNSHRFKEQQAGEEKQKLQKVVGGSVKVKKKGEMSKVKDVFISEDVSNVKSYILMDVLVPAIKKAVSDIVTNGIDMILYGETGRTKKSSGASRVSYRSYYDRKDDDRRYGSSPRLQTGYDYDEIILESRGEAEEVLARMDEAIDMYGMVSVADFYDLVGVSGNYTDNKYGWSNIRNATVVRERDGYRIKLPKALPLH